MTPKFELGRDFRTMHLPPSFIILCLLVRKLSCWRTHKQTDAAENIQLLRYATTLCKNANASAGLQWQYSVNFRLFCLLLFLCGTWLDRPVRVACVHGAVVCVVVVRVCWSCKSNTVWLTASLSATAASSWQRQRTTSRTPRSRPLPSHRPTTKMTSSTLSWTASSTT